MILINYINRLKMRLGLKNPLSETCLRDYRVLHFLRDSNLPKVSRRQRELLAEKQSFSPPSSSFCNILLRFLFQIYFEGLEVFLPGHLLNLSKVFEDFSVNLMIKR